MNRSALALVLLLAFVAHATADPAIEEKRLVRREKEGTSPLLDLAIERVWAEGPENYATVSIRNTSKRDLAWVTVRCSEFNLKGQDIGFHEASFAGNGSGPLEPGMNRKITLHLKGTGDTIRRSVHSMTCNALTK